MSSEYESIELLDIQGLYGGRNVFVSKEGPVLASLVESPKEERGLIEKRYIYNLDSQSFRNLVHEIIDNYNFLNLKIKDRMGIPDEARITINLTDKNGKTYSLSAWDQDGMDPITYQKSDKRKFDSVYVLLRNLANSACYRGKLLYDGKYRGGDGWMKFVRSKRNDRAYKHLSQGELKKIFKKYSPKLAQVDDSTGRYTIGVPGIKVYTVLRPIDLVKDPATPAKFVLTPKKKYFEMSMVHKALESMRYVPKSEEEALKAAIMVAQIKEDCYVVESIHYYAFKKITAGSKLDFSKVVKPSVQKKRGYYEITLWGYTPKRESFGIKFNDEYLTQFIIKLGKGVYEISTR